MNATNLNNIYYPGSKKYIKDDTECIKNLKLFIEEWAGPHLPEYSLEEDEVPGFLPEPLRELYLFAGNWPNPGNNDDRLFLPGKQPRIFQGQDVLMGIEKPKRQSGRVTFVMENQGNWTCEVEERNDASPVYCDAAKLWDDSVKDHEIVCDSLQHFLVTFCLQELVFGSKYVGTIEADLKPELFYEELEAVWLNGCYVFKESTHSIYICDNRLLIMDYSGLWYACNDESALNLIKDRQMIKPIE